MNPRRLASPHSRRFRHKPVVETLEQRMVLSILTWNGSVSGSWQASNNWSPNQTPVTGDDLVFPSSSPHENMVDDLTTLDPVGTLSDPSGTTLTINSFTFASDGSHNYSLSIDAHNDMSAGSELTLGSAISGSANLTTGGAGTLVFNAQTTTNYSGQLIAGGPIKIGMSTRVPKKPKVSPKGALTVGMTLGVNSPLPGLEDDGAVNVSPAQGQLNTMILSGTGKVAVGGTVNVGSTTLSGAAGTVTVDSAGTIAPGTDTTPGPLLIDGTVNFSQGSTLTIALGSSGPGAPYDQLNLDDPGDLTANPVVLPQSFPVNLGGATLNLTFPSTLATGTYSIVHAQSVTGLFANLPSGPQTIDGVPLVVTYTATSVNLTIPPTSTLTTTTIIPPGIATYGVPVPLVAVVTPTSTGGGSPIGGVAFYDNLQLIGEAPVVNNVAFTYGILKEPAGSVSYIAAVFVGIDGFTGSYSNLAGVSIVQATPMVHLTVSPIVSSRHKTTGASLVVTVAPQFVGLPSGAVTLYSNGKRSRTTELSVGVGTFNLSLTAVLGKKFTVLYSGDSNFIETSSTLVSIGKKSFNSPVSSLSLGNLGKQGWKYSQAQVS